MTSRGWYHGGHTFCERVAHSAGHALRGLSACPSLRDGQETIPRPALVRDGREGSRGKLPVGGRRAGVSPAVASMGRGAVPAVGVRAASMPVVRGRAASMPVVRGRAASMPVVRGRAASMPVARGRAASGPADSLRTGWGPAGVSVLAPLAAGRARVPCGAASMRSRALAGAPHGAAPRAGPRAGPGAGPRAGPRAGPTEQASLGTPAPLTAL